MGVGVTVLPVPSTRNLEIGAHRLSQVVVRPQPAFAVIVRLDYTPDRIANRVRAHKVATNLPIGEVLCRFVGPFNGCMMIGFQEPNIGGLLFSKASVEPLRSVRKCGLNERSHYGAKPKRRKEGKYLIHVETYSPGIDVATESAGARHIARVGMISLEWTDQASRGPSC